jgi:hypothetical protein
MLSRRHAAIEHDTRMRHFERFGERSRDTVVGVFDIVTKGVTRMRDTLCIERRQEDARVQSTAQGKPDGAI